MKKLTNSVLIEKNIEIVWKKLTIKEDNLKNFFHKLKTLVPINTDENLIGNLYEFTIKTTETKKNEKKISGTIEIENIRNEDFWKELYLIIIVNEEIFINMHFELTVFEGDKDKTLLKVDSDFDFKKKTTKFKNFINVTFLKGEKFDVEIKKVLEELKFELEY